ncbi:hypothetical protein HY345_00855 [Candidatus Microgenomates bacterium]|nr:hypothetical protein [Candidatus Microgenomates bacterium]
MIKKLGRAFSEGLEIHRFKPRKINLTNDVEEEQIGKKNRLSNVFLLLLLILVLGVLSLRLFQLTVLLGQRNREISDNNRIKLNIIKAPRGVIYDRNKEPLTRNSALYKKVTKDGSLEPIGREEALKMIAQGNTSLNTQPTREYIYATESAHVLGYLSEINKDELEELKKLGNVDYKIGDRVGRLGVEESAENILRGIDGKELIETDALGLVTKEIGNQEPISGRDVMTTLDLKMQKLMAKYFPGGQKGAVVALNPQTGEVLGMFSSPSFDPNLFGEIYTNGKDLKKKRTELAKVLTDKDSPLFNRSIGGIYPSGSTFKIVTSAAGLESGKINKETEIEDIGEIVIGPFRFPNWYFLQYGRKEGMVNVIKALQRSNDIFFYKVGEMVGLEGIVSMAKKFGLGEKTGIDLPQESTGLIPDESWKKNFIGEGWYLGDTYHLAIGQGYLLTTPLQVALMTSVVAGNGYLCQPHVLLKEGVNNYCREIGLKQETLQAIKEGMKLACTSGGTGWPFFEFFVKNASASARKMEVGCKTGTAEFGDPKDRTHAWFTVFAPFNNPQVVLTVLVEGAGEGSNVAAPIAKNILGEWLGGM